MHGEGCSGLILFIFVADFLESLPQIAQISACLINKDIQKYNGYFYGCFTVFSNNIVEFHKVVYSHTLGMVSQLVNAVTLKDN